MKASSKKQLITVLRAAIELRRMTPVAYYGPGELTDTAYAFDAALTTLLNMNEEMRPLLGAAPRARERDELHAPSPDEVWRRVLRLEETVSDITSKMKANLK